MTKYKKISSGQIYDYFACSDGYILRVRKTTYNETRVKEFLKRGTVIVKINYKEMAVKSIIAKCFIPGDHSGMIINHKDGNPWNNSVDNLSFISKKDFFNRIECNAKAESIEITAPDGRVKVYPSIRKAAKALFVSYQTILDYLNGKYKSSILNGYKIRKL